MKSSLFDYTNYKNYLNDKLTSLSATHTGQRSRLARAVACQSAYVSQVLNGQAHFSLEQGEKINGFLGHSEDESLYFLNLIQYERAGTAGLKTIFKRQLQTIAEKRLDLKTRLKYDKSLTPEEQTIYYSSWHYVAVHVLASIPTFNTRERLATCLNVSPSRIAEILDFLCRTGILAEKNGAYVIGVARIHLGKESPHIARHHINWRLRAIDALDKPTEANLHYSSVATMGHADGDRVKKILIGAIEEIRAITKDAKDESGYCYNLDFFRLSPDAN